MYRQLKSSCSRSIAALSDPPELRRLKFLPNGHWKSAYNQKNFIESIKKKLGVSIWKDFYKIGTSELIEQGGAGLLNHYSYSFPKLISSIYPQHPWNFTEFKRTPRHFWKNRKNLVTFMDSIKQKLNIQTWNDWYRVAMPDLLEVGGYKPLRQYGNSPSKLIMVAYPEHPWNVLNFKSVPHHYWHNKANGRDFMENLRVKMDIKTWTDWYRVTSKNIVDAGGAGLINHYGHSPHNLITSFYPDHDWRFFLFKKRSLEWTSKHARTFLDWIALHQSITRATSWNTMSNTQIITIRGGHSLLSKTGSLHDALRLAYPESEWNHLHASKISRPQGSIMTILSKYIARYLITSNHRHPKIYHKTNRAVEFDVWIPSLNLALEYHGEHHYHQLWENCQNPSIRRIRDTEKRSLCKSAGITLIEVPYWWDRSEEQLVSVIRAHVPSFLSSVARFDEVKPLRLDSMGIDVKARPLNLAQLWSPLHPKSTGWWATEKLDGNRACWSGSKLYSRNHNFFAAPVSLPPLAPYGVFVDGEIWNGRLSKSIAPSHLALLTFDVQPIYT